MNYTEWHLERVVRARRHRLRVAVRYGILALWTMVLCAIASRALTRMTALSSALTGLLALGTAVAVSCVAWRFDISLARLLAAISGRSARRWDRERARMEAGLRDQLKNSPLDPSRVYWLLAAEFEVEVAGSAGVRRRAAHEAIGGLTVTLNHFLRSEGQKAATAEGLTPFPEITQDTRETLVHGMMSSAGLSPAEAAKAFDVIRQLILEALRVARQRELRAVGVLPIGLYEEIHEDKPVFLSHRVLLQKYFPKVGGHLHLLSQSNFNP